MGLSQETQAKYSNIVYYMLISLDIDMNHGLYYKIIPYWSLKQTSAAKNVILAIYQYQYIYYIYIYMSFLLLIYIHILIYIYIYICIYIYIYIHIYICIYIYIYIIIYMRV